MGASTPAEAAIDARLFGAGGPFEIADERVLGERVPVFRHRYRSLRELLDASAGHGERDFVVLGERRLSFAAHHERCYRMAAWLVQRHGIAPGDRVAIFAANLPDWVVSFYATALAGGIAAAFNGWWTPAEVEQALELSAPSLVIADAARAARLPADLAVPVVEIDASGASLTLQLRASEAYVPGRIDEDDPALILFTSGTTGRSKGALLSHRGLVGFVQTTLANAARRAARAAATAPEPPPSPPATPTITLVTAPLFHVSGLFGATLLNTQTGGTMVFRSGAFDPTDVLRIIERERITNWAPLGSMGPRVLAVPDFDRHDVSSVRGIGFGGAPVSPDLMARLGAAFPNAAMSFGIGYGSSESVVAVASAGPLDLAVAPRSTGRAVPTVAIDVRYPDGASVPDGEYGEVHVRSAYTMLRYFNDDGATRAALKPGRWLAMGDVGKFEEGRLYIDSRARDMILRAAENVYPIEIEHRLEAHPAVAEAAVVGVDHPELGQEVKAVVVLRDGAEVTPGELAEFAGVALAPYKVPSKWELRREPLPRNAAGKLVKREL